MSGLLARIKLIKAEGGRRGGPFGVRVPDVEREVARVVLDRIREDVEGVKK